MSCGLVEPGGPTPKEYLPLLAVFAVVALLRWSVADIPLERDEGEYAYIAGRWLAGEAPYRSAFDQKPPGAFAAYAVIIAALGDTPAAIHWGTQIYSLATLSVVFLLGRRLFGAAAGGYAAAFLGLMMTSPNVLGNAANTETFMLLPLTAGFLLTLRAAETGSLRLSLVGGALGGAAVLCKQVAVPSLGMQWVLLVWLGRDRWRLLAAQGIGGSIALGLVAGGFALAGVWAEFWDCTVGHNLSYASRVPLRAYPGYFLATGLPLLVEQAVIAGLAVVGSVAFALLPAARTPVRPPAPCPPGWRNTAVVAGWFACSFVGVSAGGYYREHYYFQILPMAALLAGRGAVALTGLARPAWAGITLSAGILLAAVAVPVGLSPWYYWPGPADDKCDRIYDGNPFVEAVAVGHYLRDHSTADETVFVYGSEPEILVYARRRSASRYIFAYPLMTRFPDSLDRQRSVIAELTAKPPAWIVYVGVSTSFLRDEGTPRDLGDAVERMLRDSYTLVGIAPTSGSSGEPWFVTESDSSWENLRRGEVLTFSLTVWRRR